jgi:hypothetical protein
VNLDAKRGSQSLMICKGNPKRRKTFRTYNAAVSSTIISSQQGMNTDALLQLWSVTIRIESNPWEFGNLVMKSNAIVANGIASGLG